jgi:hypothetical protein
MFAAMRTGSNFLEANLNMLPGVTCHGEVFNPHFMGKKDATNLFGIDMDERDRNPLRVLAAMRRQTDGLAGFRCFHDHDARVIAHVLADPACAKIILTRNPLDSYVSLRIAQATDQWRLTNATRLRTAKVEFDAAGFEAHMTAVQDFQVELMHALQTGGQTAFYIDYDDLSDLAVLNGLAAFLGVAGRLEELDSRLKKQNPEDIAGKLVNPEAMETALARLDRFNLSRTPNFEPRRGPHIPGFIATAGAGLLYMPLRGGPEATVRHWMAATAPDGLVGDFTQKALRQWKRQQGAHRGFTVLRHPLLRAYDGYRRVVLGREGDLHRLLTRAYKLDLSADLVDIAAHRTGFLDFLRWLKLYLGGQTGQKIDARLASQSAVLNGFAQFQPPDLVLREDRLTEGLAFLAAELGLSAPAPVSQEDAALAADLALINDPEIEEAARDAYQRDYHGFSFGRWRD